MRVLVCGGRHFDDRKMLFDFLDLLRPPPAFIITGGASGADSLARLWAHERAIESETYYADWRTKGAAAGPIRNQRMLDNGHPALVVAFPGGRGTADMVRRAKAAGVRVVQVV